jgi:hypothetical protein
MAKEWPQIQTQAGLGAIYIDGFALAVSDELLFALKDVGGFIERRRVARRADVCRAVPDSSPRQSPWLLRGSLPWCYGMVPSVKKCGALPEAASVAFVDMNLATKQLVGRHFSEPGSLTLKKCESA